MSDVDTSNAGLDIEPRDTRDKLDVNSPKGKSSMVNMFTMVPKSSNDNLSANHPSSLITQVAQGDAEQQKELARLMAGQIEDKGQTKESVSSELTGKPRRCASCLSCWWLCCGSCSVTDSINPVKLTEESSTHDDGNTINPAGSEQREEQPYSESTKVSDSGERKVVAVDQGEESKPFEDQNGATIEWLLDSPHPSDVGKKCLVLDLDETLVHSSFQTIDCSFAISIELDGAQYGVSVLKRPFVDEFIAECAKLYEVVIFTASLPEYANPVIDRLDSRGLIKSRLFRESCVFHEERVYVKDLSRLRRNIKDCIIIDNSPLSYLFHPTNAIACTSWFGDDRDTELRDLLPVLRGELLTVGDVRSILDAKSQSCQWLIDNYGNTNDKREHIYTE